jgi:hypothetical protein
MTRTIPLRRTILQFSQIRRTLLRTFMTLPLTLRPSDRRIHLYNHNCNKTQV